MGEESQFDAAESDWNDWHWQVAGSTAMPNLADIQKRVLIRYPGAITPYYASLATSWDQSDPIAAQCLPDPRELDECSSPDPLGELCHRKGPGLIHRYRDRAVLMVTGACAVRCRHCTRKNTIPELNPASDAAALDESIAYIEKTPELREILISGGDALLLEDEALEAVLRRLRAIETVQVMRIGSRAPVVMPMRITGRLCDILGEYRPLWFNTQFNHPAELTKEAKKACDAIQARGIPVSNQCVLLKGINDDLAVLKELFTELQAMSVRPYYVFLCDHVAGTSHFWVSRERAQELARELRNEIGGLAMPLFVEDVPGADAKVPII